MDEFPTRDQLRGFSKDKAALYGMPHINAFYTADDVNRYALEQGAICPICRRRATNVHHVPPKSSGRSFVLTVPHGNFVLRPALFGLCGSGTTGCHGNFHSGNFKAKWVWENPEYEKAWWSGEILKYIEPHSPSFYEIGHWEIETPEDLIEYRGF